MDNEITVATLGVDAALVKEFRANLKKISSRYQVLNLSKRSKFDWFLCAKMESIDAKALVKQGKIADIGQLIVISSDDEAHYIREWLCREGIRHCVGNNAPNLVAELCHIIGVGDAIVTGNERLLQLFFEDKYSFCHKKIAQSMGVFELIEAADTELVKNGFKCSYRDQLMIIANELITNAVFNSPHDKKGKSIFSDRRRSRQVTLDKAQQGDFFLARSKAKTVIMVRDPFGCFDHARIMHSLKKMNQNENPIEKSGGGAGIGIMMTFTNCNCMIIDVDPGNYTRIICIIEHHERNRAFCERLTSFHYYARKEA